MSTIKKRYRACEECQRHKIKCEADTSTPDTCARCKRHDLNCVPAAPRFQRDRIAELEHQVQELKLALQDQSNKRAQMGICSPSNSSNYSAPSSVDHTHNHSHKLLAFLDARVSLHVQQEALGFYTRYAGALWPVVRLPRNALDRVRATKPTLLLAVLAFAVPAGLSGIEIERQDELVREIMRVLGDEVIRHGRRSLDIVQALLMTAFWSRSAREEDHGSCYQIVQIATDMAIDLGIGGPRYIPSPPAFFSRIEDTDSLEARRTWLACFVATASSAISVRRPPTVYWDSYHEECLLYLESEGEIEDALLCRIVRIFMLFQEIADQLRLCRLTDFVDPSNADVQSAMGILRAKVDVWTAENPRDIVGSGLLQFWHHIALIYIHEIILHTPSNKSSFAAPFIPGKISVRDVPMPANVAPVVADFLDTIVENCQLAIREAAAVDPICVLCMPSFCFAPAVAYSRFVLINLHVATTCPGNTYGWHVSLEKIRARESIRGLDSLGASLMIIDPTLSTYTTRIIDATRWLDAWFDDYVTILERYEMNLAGSTEDMGADPGIY